MLSRSSLLLSTLKQSTVVQQRAISTTMTTSASRDRSEAGQIISDVSRQEGGTTKGSTAAQLQSELTKQRNAQQAEQALGSKVATDPSSVTAEDAQTLHSRESRALGGQQPRSGSLASQAQSLAAKNEQGTSVNGQSNAGPTDPAVQSQLDRQKNYESAAEAVKQKLEQNPEAVTKEDGNLMHSRETKAFGTTEKGGLASHAQSQASKNEQ